MCLDALIAVALASSGAGVCGDVCRDVIACFDMCIAVTLVSCDVSASNP